MARVNESISMFSGETKVIYDTIVDSDNNNTPLDLNGFSIKFLVHDKGEQKILKTIQNGGVVIEDASAGICKITLLPADTQNLSGNYSFEVRVTAGNQSSIVTLGRLTITKVYS